jgi:Protein of unknown function (DUF1456)
MMTNNEIFKKLRVALMLRDEQIVEILELVDFRITKSELGAFFRAEDHENYVACGDQILRNFLNGLVIHLRGTKENPKNPNEVLHLNKETVNQAGAKSKFDKPKFDKPKTDAKKPNKRAFEKKAVKPKIQVVEKVKFSNGKPKKH